MFIIRTWSSNPNTMSSFPREHVGSSHGRRALFPSARRSRRGAWSWPLGTNPRRPLPSSPPRTNIAVPGDVHPGGCGRVAAPSVSRRLGAAGLRRPTSRHSVLAGGLPKGRPSLAPLADALRALLCLLKRSGRPRRFRQQCAAADAGAEDRPRSLLTPRHSRPPDPSRGNPHRAPLPEPHDRPNNAVTGNPYDRKSSGPSARPLRGPRPLRGFPRRLFLLVRRPASAARARLGPAPRAFPAWRTTPERGCRPLPKDPGAKLSGWKKDWRSQCRPQRVGGQRPVPGRACRPALASLFASLCTRSSCAPRPAVRGSLRSGSRFRPKPRGVAKETLWRASGLRAPPGRSPPPLALEVRKPEQTGLYGHPHGKWVAIYAQSKGGEPGATVK